MKQLLCFLCITLLTASVGADASSPLVLEVRAVRISRAQLASSLQAELAASSTPEVGGSLELSDEPSDVVRIVYRDAQGNRTVRDLKLAADDPEVLEKVTLAAVDLLRNQEELVASLAALPAPAQAIKAQPAPRARTSAQAHLTRLQTPSPDDPCKLEPVLVIAGDLAPYLGASSLPQGRNSARHVSLSLLGSLSQGTRGVTISPGINIDRRGVCGLALGTGNASLGPVRGAQLGVGNLAHGGLTGLQAGVANGASGGITGAQLGVANGAFGHVAGAQLGVSNVVVGDVHGVQLGVGNVSSAGVDGLQAGVLNLSGGTATVQLGTANLARGDVNTQLGVFNLSNSAKAPIGVLSIVRHGRTALDAWVTENGTLLAGVMHGGRYVHNFYAVGSRVGSTGTRAAAALGIGARLLSRERFTLDLDLIGDQLFRGQKFRQTLSTVRLRLALAFFVTDRIAVVGGLGYAFQAARDLSERSQAPFGQHKLWQSNGNNPSRGYTFPSATLGLRIALGKPTP